MKQGIETTKTEAREVVDCESPSIDFIYSESIRMEEMIPIAARADGSTIELMQGLIETVIKEQVWPRIIRDPNPSLLFRLRCINKYWHAFVGSTVEWNALESVRIDIPHYYKNL